MVAALCANPAQGQWNTTNGGPPIYYNLGPVGIGTTAPQQTLHVDAGVGGSTGGFLLQGGGDNFTYTSLQISHTDWRGGYVTPWIDNLVHNGINYSSIPNANGGLDGSLQLYTVNYMPLQFGTDNTARVTLASSGFVGIGLTNPQHLLHVAGTIGAEEVVISSTGADYVFGTGYRLQPLNEVNAYIQDHHHLPDIPSEAEVKEKGIGVGDMQTKLLAKIEELTLHMIQAEERSNRLEQQVKDLRDQLAGIDRASESTAK